MAQAACLSLMMSVLWLLPHRSKLHSSQQATAAAVVLGWTLVVGGVLNSAGGSTSAAAASYSSASSSSSSSSAATSSADPAVGGFTAGPHITLVHFSAQPGPFCHHPVS